MTTEQLITMKDLKTEDPRWCTGCGDYSILVGLRKLLVKYQLEKENTVNISGIGCSGRIPHYLNTYGLHGIHGRAVPLATGLIMTRPELKVFIHSGDGDSLSIGGNHLMHGIHKNLNCVYLLFDNQIYGLTKNQTSPTTAHGHATETQPEGSYLKPINPIRFAIGMGATFVASTAEWLSQHFLDTVDKAFNHNGFSYVHVAQRCPKYNPEAWRHKDSDWMTFLTHEEHGIPIDTKRLPDARLVDHDPTHLESAFKISENVPQVMGLFYKTDTVCYDQEVRARVEATHKKDLSQLLDAYVI